MKKTEISGAELDVMQVLWKYGHPMRVQEVWEKLQGNSWKYKTVATLLLRLEEKGAVTCEKDGKANRYTAVLDKADYTRAQTKRLIRRLYNDSARELVVALLEGDDISQEDIVQIRKMFDL